MDTLRLFIGVETTHPVQKFLRQRWGALGLSGAYKVVPPERYHLTIAFLGDCSVEEVPGLIAALEQAAAHHESLFASFNNFILLPVRRPSAVAAGILPTPELHSLYTTVVEAVAPVTTLALVGRRYLPHVALARSREPISEADQNKILLAEPLAMEFPLMTLTLFESRFDGKEHNYYPLASADLA